MSSSYDMGAKPGSGANREDLAKPRRASPSQRRARRANQDEDFIPPKDRKPLHVSMGQVKRMYDPNKPHYDPRGED
jgi:hypothetical protein